MGLREASDGWPLTSTFCKGVTMTMAHHGATTSAVQLLRVSPSSWLVGESLPVAFVIVRATLCSVQFVFFKLAGVLNLSLWLLYSDS